jgi:hypothetical protein
MRIHAHQYLRPVFLVRGWTPDESAYLPDGGADDDLSERSDQLDVLLPRHASLEPAFV